MGHQVRPRVRQPPLRHGRTPPQKACSDLSASPTTQPVYAPKSSACHRPRPTPRPASAMAAGRSSAPTRPTSSACRHGPFLDLDVVIVGDLTEFFEVPGEFPDHQGLEAPWRVTGNPRSTGSGSVRMPMLQHFIDHQDEVRAQYRKRAGIPQPPPRCPGQAGLLAQALVRQLQVPLPADVAAELLARPFIPTGARVLVFHGDEPA